MRRGCGGTPHRGAPTASSPVRIAASEAGEKASPMRRRTDLVRLSKGLSIRLIPPPIVVPAMRSALLAVLAVLLVPLASATGEEPDGLGAEGALAKVAD